MSKLRYEDEGVSVFIQIIAIICMIGLVGVSVYIVTKWAEKPKVREVHSLSISAEPSKTAGQSSSITVRAYDAEGNPVRGASISLVALAIRGGYTGDYEVNLALTDRGDGTYTSNLTSTWAGVYSIHASVVGTDIVASANTTFEPGAPANIVVSATSPKPASSAYKSTVTFYFADAYGNSLPPNRVQPGISPSEGWHVENLRSSPKGLFSFDFVTDNWGTATVSITDNATGISGSTHVKFSPIYLESSMKITPPEIELIHPKDLDMQTIEEGKQELSVNVGIFIPPTKGQLGMYHMTIEYDSSLLYLINVLDGNPADEFPAPIFEVLSENSFRIRNYGTPTGAAVDVAILNFEAIALGKGSILITDVQLSDTAWKPIEVPVTFENKSENVKVLKRLIVPIKAWIVDNSGTSEADVRSDAEKKAENMLNTNSLACVLDYEFVFIVEINRIPKDNWDNIAGADNKLSWAEVDILALRYRWGRWINVYYVPNCTLPKGALGWWRRKDNIILIDDKKDFDNLTLAHELVHEFSKSEVKDSPENNAAAQGGTRPRNIMNYDDTGGDISGEQGKLINEEIERRRDEAGLYKPYRPGPAPPP